MKKIFNIFLSLLAAGLVTVSCDLNEYPLGSIVYGGKIVEKENDLLQIERAMHARYRSCHFGQNYIMEEVMLDAFNATIGYGNNYGSVHRLDNNFTTSDDYITTYWQYCYWAIQDYNFFLESTEKVPEGLEEKAAIGQGYAYFYRASTYLELIRRFAVAYDPATAEEAESGVPIILKYDQLAKPKRSSIKAVYDQIYEDLLKAESLLAEEKGAVRAEKPTIDAVNAMWARYYLDIKEYGEAAAKANLVIDSEAGYTLASTADEMKTEFRNDSGKEPVIQLYASKSETPNGMGSFTSATQNTAEGIYYQPYFLPSKTLISAYDNTDLRLAQWFDKTLKIESQGTFYNFGDVYLFTKYLGNPNLYTTPYPQAYQAEKPITVSEMYLIAAEASLLADDVQGAQGALNALQSARKATPTDATIEAIQKEWLREKVGEGLRLSCFKRWGIGFNGRPGQDKAVEYNMLSNVGDSFTGKVLAADDFRLKYWPIPYYEIQVNPNLKQNDGYTLNAAADEDEGQQGEGE